jgi:hypothetical protein
LKHSLVSEKGWKSTFFGGAAGVREDKLESNDGKSAKPESEDDKSSKSAESEDEKSDKKK